MHKAVTWLCSLVVVATLLVPAGRASALPYFGHKIWDLQYVRFPDQTERVVFKTCNADFSVCFWWHTPDDELAASHIRAVAVSAFLKKRLVNIRCFPGPGQPAGDCPGVAGIFVFENNQLAEKTVFEIHGLQAQ